MRTIKSLNLKEKKVLLRCDFNVPLGKEGNVLDDFRIKQSIKTIEYLEKKKAKTILISHLGRPSKIKKYSLKLIVKSLEKQLNKKVVFLNDSVGEVVEKEIAKMKAGQVILLENLRFYREEEEGSLSFAQKLAKPGEVYINDAFGASHRAHASIVGLPRFLPSAAGFLLEKEVSSLSKINNSQERPLIVIIGGAKIETKIKLIDKMSERADFVLVGGLLAQEAEKRKIKLKRPQKIIKPVNEKEKRDIGPKTINLFKEKIRLAKMIFWNGPLGQIEKKEFTKGTEEIAKAIVRSRAFSVAGGGETVEFINKIGLTDKFNHLSTGGGAMLEFLSGNKLPGIEALK